MTDVMLRSASIQEWWPTTQSLDLVEGPVEAVAAAVHAEVRRFADGAVEAWWEAFPDLNSAFNAAPNFANVPTFFLVLPTISNWTVLWNNSILCDGYDSLCWCLTKNHGLSTIHWSANDQWTSFQSGATFTHRRLSGSTLVERSVCAAQEDRRWLFVEVGDPLPEEDLPSYRARKKRDRLNESQLSKLLARLGAVPWSEDFYALTSQRAFVLRRTALPPTIVFQQRAEVVGMTGK